MGETKHDGLAVPGRALLAHEPAFRLGSVKVSPPTREVIIGGERRTIEPRVMQVLVVLAKAKGAVVSRDELIDLCWDGRIVGDDAINHAIGKLRQLALESDDVFGIETIPRVGHRLIASGQIAPDIQHLVANEQKSWLNRRAAIGSAAALGTLGLGGLSLGLLSRRGQPDLAKTYYERGLATRGQGYSNEYEQAVGYFRRAVEIDPDYAEAWGALAWSYRVLLATEDPSHSAQLTALAKAAAQRAIELDADNADAGLALLLLRPNYRRWAEVESGCRRLLDKHPHHSLSQFQLAYVLGETGRWREAIPHMESVCNREPTWPMARFRLFEDLSNSGRVEEADARIDEAMRLAPRNAHFWASKINYLLLTERQADAAALAAIGTLRPADDELVELENMLVAARGSRSMNARKLTVDRLLKDARAGDPEMAYRAAIGIAMLGELDASFSLLDGYYFGRGPWAAKREMWPPTHPLFSLAVSPLRQDSRFKRLLDETGLEAFWRDTNTDPDFRRFAA